MKYDFYQAEHPWGPWTLIRSQSDNFLVGGHMYGPSLCARFQEPSGSDVRMSLFTSGCPFDDVPAGIYKIWEIPLILKTAPVPPSVLINDDDPAITYRGSWKAIARRDCGYHHDDLHATTQAGDSLELTFKGTGIEYIAEKYNDLGDVDISIDGVFRANVNLAMKNFPRISQVVAFRADDLPPGAAHDPHRQQERGLRGDRCLSGLRRQRRHWRKATTALKGLDGRPGAHRAGIALAPPPASLGGLAPNGRRGFVNP